LAAAAFVFKLSMLWLLVICHHRFHRIQNTLTSCC